MSKIKMPAKKKNSPISEKKGGLKPRITERATVLGEHSVYVFNVGRNQNKTEIRKAFEKEFGKKPVKIGIVQVKGKTIMHRGRLGFKQGGKKAYVYLKKGEKIEISK